MATIGDDNTILANHIGPWLVLKQEFLDGLPSEDRDLIRKWLDGKKGSEELQKQIEHLQNRKDIERWKPWIDGVKTLDSVISPIAGLVPHGIGAILWGGVTVLIKLVTTSVEFFESIQEFLDTIGHELSLFQDYEKLYSKYGSSRFNDSLQQVFSRYVYFCLAVHRFCKSSRWQKLMKSMKLSRRKDYPDITFAVAEVQGVCSRARDAVDLVAKQAQSAANEVIIDLGLHADETAQEHHREVQQRFRILDQAEENRLLREFRDWISRGKVTEWSMESELMNNVRKRVSDTCIWAFADESIRSWTSSTPDSTRALWIQADAGFGKSVLSSYIITEMQKLHPTGVAYFFCKHDVQQQTSILWILKIWILQLLSLPHSRGPTVPGHFSIDPNTVTDFNNNEEPTILVIDRLMRQLLRVNKPTRLIVDGLDECPVPTEEEMLEWEIFFNLLANLPSQWKVLIVSRPHNWYNKKLHGKFKGLLKEKTITTQDNEDDLRKFVVGKVEKFRKIWSAQMMEKTQRVMLDKAQGNLMWVYLLCEALAASSEDEIQDILDRPPDDLGQLYGRALKNLSVKHKNWANKVRLALKWILFSYRPLKVEELEQALQTTLEMNENNILGFIGPLIKIEGKIPEIRLVHASAREYLVSPDAKILEENSVTGLDQLANDNVIILKRCLEYLTSDKGSFIDVGTDEGVAIDRFQQHLKEHKLLEYSANGWIQHLVQAYRNPEALKSVKEELSRMLSSPVFVLRWLQVFHFLWNGPAPSEPARSHIVALTYRPRGTNDWADFLTDEFPDFVAHLGWEDGRRYTRWDRFMHRQHEDHWGHPYTYYQSPRVLPAISVAAFFDYDQEVAAMIDDGIGVNHKGPLHGTPLHWAAAGGACRAMRLLIDKNADKEAKYGKCGETPIFRAIRVPKAGVFVRGGHYPAAKLLFDQGVKLSHEKKSKGFLISTALIALVEEEADCPEAAEFVRDLCTRDKAVEESYVRHGTISQLAAWHNRPHMLRELLRLEPQQNFLNIQGVKTRRRTVLHDACTKDNPEITKILLDLGADPDQKCILNGYTPLHFSVCAGVETFNVLLDREPLIDLSQSDEIEEESSDLTAYEGKQWPIHLVARFNAKVDLKKLIDRGGYVDQVDGNGDTPLTIALENSNFEMAKKLLDLGADPEKVRRPLGFHLPLEEQHKSLKRLERTCWKDVECWKGVESYDYVSCLRRISGKDIPIPIIDRILRFAAHTDLLKMTRKGRMSVNEHITMQIPLPYLMSPPIMGNAVSPVRHIETFVHSRDQGHSNEDGRYSHSKLVTLNGDLKIVHWQPEVHLGHNVHHWQDYRHVVTKKSASRQMSDVRHGDRLGIFPFALYPPYECVIDCAEIEVRQLTLRSYFTRTEQEQIWGKHYDKTPMGLECEGSGCARCAAKKALKDWVQPVPEPGPDHELKAAEMQRFIEIFELTKGHQH